MAGMGIIEADQSTVTSVDGKDADGGWLNSQSLKQIERETEVVSNGELDCIGVRDANDPASRMFMFDT
jgi:hypothetical protein